ncbi:twin-arginine translocase TatA/TatE family subunit [Cellulomonas hominis]|uniref:twin-arginine translocase TatA/TatE family subunit n=1 Tax=Cellulomonas hominis TaxID=156981 RepID=UPI001C115A37|nr:twin-arginine translocase TatA/TatE family subunit [Cellulomonas hominis]MBU5424347.1 twin-arginine translocase TatA/TatE family subunit [Cellulomonas hominis]
MGRLFEHPAAILFLILIVLLLFGAKRLPDVAKGVGQSLKIFKREVRDLTEDDDKPAPPAVPTVPPTAAAPPAPAAPATPPAPVAPAATEQGSTDPRP